MKVAAMIFGILAGLSGFILAQIGHMVAALGQSSIGSIFYLLPLASLLGGGLALNVPVVAGGLMAASALGWLAIGASLGAAINIFSITAVSLNALGAFLAFASLNQESGSPPSDNFAGMTGATDKSTSAAQMPHASSYQYDRAKWNSLVEYDPDIAKVADQLKPLGQKYIDQFAAGYLVLNDKSYIPAVLKKVLETVEQDAAAWNNRFSDPEYLKQFIDKKIDFFMRAPFGTVVMLKDSKVLTDRGGVVSKFDNAGQLRALLNDHGEWPLITDEGEQLLLVRTFALHIPE